MKSKLSATRGWLIVIFGLILAIRTAHGIWRVYKSRDQIILAQKSAEEVKAENENLKKQLAKVQTDEFVIEEARTKLGYARPGEVLIALSEQSNPNPQISNLKFKISNFKPSITRLGMGIPTGADLEYADEVTLTEALAGRREL